MATVTRPSTPLPDPGDEMDAEQVRDWINNLLTFLESTNIDEANVDLTSTDGVMGKSTAQTVTGKKTFESTNAAAAGIVEVAELGLNPASGTAADNDGGRVVLYADDDGGNATDLVNLDWVLTDASNGSEDAEFRIRALKAGTMTEFLTAGSTSAGVGRVAVTGDLTVAGAITATDTTAPLILKYDAGEYVTHAVSAAGVYSIATTDDSSDSGAITLDTVDSITFDSDTASEGVVYADGGTSLLRISNSSSDVIIKPLVDAKDIIFQQYDETEVLKIDDDASVKIGGGYGSTGVTISTAGVIQANGAISSDGAVTGATLAGTISTAAQNSITSASSLATVGTITSGTWSGVIDGSATMTLGSDATGDIYYRDASGFLERLASGADGTVLTGTGAGAIPAWESPTTGDITSVVAGVGLSGGGTTGDVTLTLDISELSTVTPADGDFFATLDSDGANEQKTTTTALATLFAGAGMTATSAVLNVIGGDGITANSNDVAITAAQTTVTSVLNASLAVGRDADNQIKFGTDDQIVFEVAGGDGVTFKASGEIEATSLDISGDADIDGTLEADAITLGGTALGSLYSPIAGSGSIATVGTVTSGTWSGVIDGSATMTLGSDATGDIYYRDASGFLERLGASTDGYVLTTGGAGTVPAWEAAASGGSLSGSTNNTVATVTGANALAGEANLTFDGSTLALNGTYSSGANGPNIEFRGSATDAYPSMQILNYSHDDQSVNFDAYYDGTWKSSDAGSNFSIRKAGDKLALRYDTGISAGSALTWNEGFIMDGTGKVGLGGTPTVPFHIFSAVTGDVVQWEQTNTGGSFLRFRYNGITPDNNTVHFLHGSDGTANRVYIYSDGDLANHDGTYGTISDVKLKQDITDVRSYWDDFKSLQYRKFRHKTDVELDADAPYRLGLVAQEVETIFPALVPESPDADIETEEAVVDEDGEAVLDDDGNPTYETVSTPSGTTHKWVKSSIVEGPIMGSVVQELQTRLEAAEAKITALESA